MKLKFDENGNVVHKDVKPVFVDDDGKDIEVDVPRLFEKVKELNSENKTHREAKEAAVAQLSVFKGIEDVPKWKEDADKALETVKNYSQKQLVDASKVDEIKSEMKLAHTQELERVNESFVQKEADYKKRLDDSNNMIFKLMVSEQFSRSPYFTGASPKTNLLPDVAEAYFGGRFKVESVGNDNGNLRVTGYDEKGKPIYSRSNPGELANFNEAIEAIIDSHPKKNHFLVSAGAGSGAGGGGAGGGAGDTNTQLASLRKQHADLLKAGTADAAQKAIAVRNRIDALVKEGVR
jgi:hypothetical protein